MQILQWLFKNTNETNSNTTSSNKDAVNDQEVKPRDVVLFEICPKKKRAGKTRSTCKIFSVFNILRKKEIATKYFYSTIHLKRLKSSHRRKQFFHCMKKKKQSLTRGQNQVLPIADTVGTIASSLMVTNFKEQSASVEKKEKAKGDKTKSISKMKELIRWAAATKSEKRRKHLGGKVQVLHLCNRPILKAVPDDDQISNYDSPKISFRWDQISNSTAVRINHCPAANREGNWVTTDSEFVVLELEL